MNKNRHELKTECRASQSFLLSKTRENVPSERLEPGEYSGRELPEIEEFSPDVRSGEAFLSHALRAVESSPAFGVLALQIDAPVETDLSDEAIDDNGSVQAVIRTLDEVCDRHDGIWGGIDHRLFGCYFANKDEKTCLEISEVIKQTLSTHSRRTVTIGVAVFPVLDFTMDQILGNALKALDHATFFGHDSLVPFDAVSLNISGDRFYERGDVQSAIDEFNKGLLLDPADTNIHNSLGVCYGVLGNLQQALDAFNAVIEIDCSDALAIYNAGLTSTLTGDRDAALEYFRKAADRPETGFEAAIQTGRLYLGENEPEKGRPYIEKAAELRPESCAAYSSLGECYTALGMTTEAVTAYKKAIRLNANDAAALSGLGWLYNAQRKNPEIAALFCRQSVEIAPDNGLFRQRLGRLYLDEDRFHDALSELNKAAELGCDSSKYIEKANLYISENGL